MRNIFPRLRLRHFLVILFIGIAGTLSAQQLQIQVNKKTHDPRNCISLKKLKTISLQDTAGVRVEVILIRGKRAMEAKNFNSVEEFNLFNMKAWLNEDNLTQGRSKAREGDRLFIQLQKQDSDQMLKSNSYSFCEK